MTDLGTLPGGTTCHGVAINNAGSVAGTCTDNTGQTDAFFKPASGSIVKLPAVAAGKPCRVVGMTDAGVIAGNCESATHGKFVPVVWPAGSPRPAPIVLNPVPLSGDIAAAVAITRDNVVGTSTDNGGKIRPVIWQHFAQNPTELATPGNGPDALACAPVAVNDNTPNPAVAGTCELTAGGTEAVRWTTTGSTNFYLLTELALLAANGNCFAVDINANQQVAGSCQNAATERNAVRWPAGTAPPIIPVALALPPGSKSSAVAMNAKGLVTGNFVSAAGFRHAFFWNPANGDFFDAGTLPGGHWSTAVGISGNSTNTITGTSEFTAGAAHAFTFTVAGGIADLGTLGGFSSAASDINDNGKVTGTSETPTGNNHATSTREDIQGPAERVRAIA
jgi:probable HAF family extracellular repeat protein